MSVPPVVLLKVQKGLKTPMSPPAGREAGRETRRQTDRQTGRGRQQAELEVHRCRGAEVHIFANGRLVLAAIQA